MKRLKQVKVLSDSSSILGIQVKVERETQLHICLHNENLKIKKPEQYITILYIIYIILIYNIYNITIL